MAPKMRNRHGANPLSVTDDMKGRMCTLSFHVYSSRRIECYWYFQSGSCTRFRPQYLYNLWPMYFVQKGNEEGFKRITEKMVNREWRIPTEDHMFDLWYQEIIGRKHVQ